MPHGCTHVDLRYDVTAVVSRRVAQLCVIADVGETFQAGRAKFTVVTASPQGQVEVWEDGVKVGRREQPAEHVINT